MRGTFSSFLAVALLASLVRPFFLAEAAEIRSGDKVVIPKDETIEDDLYAFGQEITIDGTVEGDVIAWGGQITVNGTVNGKVMAIGQTVVITGETGGARIAGQVLKLGPKAKLDGDLLAGGFSLECAPGSEVTWDVIYCGFQSLFSGQIGNNLGGKVVNCRLEGATGGDVNIAVGGDKNSTAMNYGPPPPVAMPAVPGGFTIADTATIDGDLKYQAKQEAAIDPQATVSGETTFSQPQPAAKNGRPAAAAPSLLTKAFGRVKHLACVGLVGLAVLLLLPRWSTAWADTIRTRPGASFLGGLVGLGAFLLFLVMTVIIIAVVALLLAGIRLTELVPMVVVGGIVGYVAVIVGFWILAAFLAEALAGLAIGRLALRDNGLVVRCGALVLGLLLVSVVLSVPYLGSLIGFVIFIFGIGSICLWLIGQTPAPLVQSFAPLPAAKPIPATVL